MHIVLIGYMGSGKSSIGKQLAAKLGYTFTDLDGQIEAEEKRSISEIFLDKGVLYFRNRENSLLRTLAKEDTNSVIATGGGTPCYGDTMDFLLSNKRCITVYLKASLEPLCDRLFLEKDNRPLIAHIEDKEVLKDFVRKHLFERAFYYNQSEITISIDGATIEEILEEIVARLF